MLPRFADKFLACVFPAGSRQERQAHCPQLKPPWRQPDPGDRCSISFLGAPIAKIARRPERRW